MTCKFCEGPLPPLKPRGGNLCYCSQICRIKAKRKRENARRYAWDEPRFCGWCDDRFKPVHHSQTTCSFACNKQRQHANITHHNSIKKVERHIDSQIITESEGKRMIAALEAERKQRQADIIARHSIKLNPTRDTAPKPAPAIKPAPARTWQNCPDRSAKTGRCAKHDKPCFDVRTRTAACKL